MSSNNDILWLTTLDVLEGEEYPEMHVFREVLDFLWAFKFTNGDESKGRNYSFDNMIGVACWLKMFGQFDESSNLPLWGHHMLRPDNAAFFLYSKHPRIGFFFIWIKSIALWISVLRKTRKDRNGLTYFDTDGINLGRLILMSHKMPVTEWVFNKLIKIMWGHWTAPMIHYHKGSSNILQKEIHSWLVNIGVDTNT